MDEHAAFPSLPFKALFLVSTSRRCHVEIVSKKMDEVGLIDIQARSVPLLQNEFNLSIVVCLDDIH